MNLKAKTAKFARAARETRHTKPSAIASRLAISFALIAAMTAILAGAITYITWSFAFENYVRRNLQHSAEYVAQHAASSYEIFGDWDFSFRVMIPQVAPRQDVIVQIFDNEGNLIYDESIFNPPAGARSSEESGTCGLEELDAYDAGVVTAPVVVDLQRVGEVRVLAHGSTGLLTPHDLQMRTTSLIALSVAGVIAMIASTFMGIVSSRRIIKPILQVTETVKRLRDGDENARTGLADDGGEVSQLGFTFDRMADSIQSDRERERRMTSGVAHELRTPLMGIQATVEAIEDGVYPADSEHLSIITQETKRLTHLTDSLLELSRLENEKTDFPLSLVSVSEPIDASVAVNVAHLKSMGLKLELELDSQLKVYANMARLQQAVTNLLSNSIRYTPAGGTIVIRSYARGDQVCIAVEDTGIGIAKEDLGHVFNRFWRADTARDRATGGTGIGLPITREIIERHKGTIEVESVEREGTTFTISLPKAS